MTINNYPTHTEVTVFTDNTVAMKTFRAESHLLGLRFEVLPESTVARIMVRAMSGCIVGVARATVHRSAQPTTGHPL